MLQSTLRLVIPVLIFIWLTACSSNRTALPLVTAYSGVQSATQQDVLARAIDQAVDRLDFDDLSGASAICDINGVFPHTDNQLNNYIATQVKGKMARSGIRIFHKTDDPRKADYRCTISIASTGAKEKVVRERLNGGALAANIFLQFPTLFTSWIWLPIHWNDRYYIGYTRLLVHLIAQRGQASRLISAEGERVVHFSGLEPDHYPQAEGSILNQHIQVEKSSSSTGKNKPKSPDDL